MTLGKFPASCLWHVACVATVLCLPSAHVTESVGAASVSLLLLETYDRALLYQVLGSTVKLVDVLALLQYFRPLGPAVPTMPSRDQCEGISISHRQKIIYLS